MLTEIEAHDLDRIAAMEVGAYIVNFYSKSCGPCLTMKPVLESLGKHNPDTRIYRIDATKNSELASRFGVRGVPATFFCEGREVIYSVVGVTPEFEMQRVLNSWDNPIFRETGELPPVNKRPDYLYTVIIAVIVLVFVGLLIFLN